MNQQEKAVYQEGKYVEGRMAMVKALLALSEELKQVARGLQEETIFFVDSEEVIGQTIERCLGDVL